MLISSLLISPVGPGLGGPAFSLGSLKTWNQVWKHKNTNLKVFYIWPDSWDLSCCFIIVIVIIIIIILHWISLLNATVEYLTDFSDFSDHICYMSGIKALLKVPVMINRFLINLYSSQAWLDFIMVLKGR